MSIEKRSHKQQQKSTTKEKELARNQKNTQKPKKKQKNHSVCVLVATHAFAITLYTHFYI